MANPIKETPVLYGADARRFEQAMKEHRPPSPEVQARMLKNYEIFKRIAKFPLP
jgi:hypothetical protein